MKAERHKRFGLPIPSGLSFEGKLPGEKVVLKWLTVATVSFAA
jgi:hypothetical protein